MSKVRCTRCDICGVEMGSRDTRWQLVLPRRARLYYGLPELGMTRCDVCADCMWRIIKQLEKGSMNSHDSPKATT